jgi:hypothetical protein
VTISPWICTWSISPGSKSQINHSFLIRPLRPWLIGEAIWCFVQGKKERQESQTQKNCTASQYLSGSLSLYHINANIPGTGTP